ncbi:MAG: hypothetical protein JRF63_12470, partial [Deltaproteobacteria bacterium]|nr:hypothetical protein [Deltaproteobacteria bacterium]
MAKLEKLARTARIPVKPGPKVARPGPKDHHPCDVRVAVVISGALKEVRVWCRADSVLKPLAPLIDALEDIRVQMFEENNFVEEGL